MNERSPKTHREGYVGTSRGNTGFLAPISHLISAARFRDQVNICIMVASCVSSLRNRTGAVNVSTQVASISKTMRTHVCVCVYVCMSAQLIAARDSAGVGRHTGLASAQPDPFGVEDLIVCTPEEVCVTVVARVGLDIDWGYGCRIDYG